MTPALVHHQPPVELPAADRAARARDWSEIQERMVVPLCEAVYERLGTGPGSRVLELGCGAGLALLLAAQRGAEVCGVEADAARLELAAERLCRPDEGSGGEPRPWTARLSGGCPAEVMAEGEPPTLVTAFGSLPDAEQLVRVTAALPLRTPVVLAGWGPMERCAAAPALRVATRLAEPSSGHAGWWGRDDLEELAVRCGLRPDGSGRVACPFGYAGMESAVRGLLSTGLYDDVVRATDEEQVLKELTEALHPYLRADGTVWMPNLFRYVVALTHSGSPLRSARGGRSVAGLRRPVAGLGRSVTGRATPPL